MRDAVGGVEMGFHKDLLGREHSAAGPGDARSSEMCVSYLQEKLRRDHFTLTLTIYLGKIKSRSFIKATSLSFLS